MAFSARVLLDSRSPSGARLTTFEVRYPRFIHSEMMTHRMFSRNAASSRAIPIKKMIAAVREEPAMPVHWGRNQTGMSAREEIRAEIAALAQAEWRAALDDALRHAERLSEKDIDLHKQLVNRLLEPFAWITVIITATEWANFFTQRAHEDAQPEIRHIAEMMLARLSREHAAAGGVGPLASCRSFKTTSTACPKKNACKISVARCARVSYLTHDGKRDHAKDVELYDRLLGGGANGHWSPFEHVATPAADAPSVPATSSAGNNSASASHRSTPRRFPTRTPLPVKARAARRCCWHFRAGGGSARSRPTIVTSPRSRPTGCCTRRPSRWPIRCVNAARAPSPTIRSCCSPAGRSRRSSRFSFSGSWATPRGCATLLRRRMRDPWIYRGVFGAALGALATLASRAVRVRIVSRRALRRASRRRRSRLVPRRTRAHRHDLAGIRDAGVGGARARRHDAPLVSRLHRAAVCGGAGRGRRSSRCCSRR